MSTSEKETRASWLLRAMGEKQSCLFHLDVVIEEDEPGLFGAFVVGMEDTMGASGNTVEEAAENARLLFMATVDDAIDAATSIAFAIGATTSDYTLLNIPISRASEIFDALHQKDVDEEEEWLRIPPAGHPHPF